MAKEQLAEISLRNIDEGLLLGLADTSIQEIVENIIARPGCRKKRTVDIHIEITPEENPVEGVPEMPSVNYTVDTKMPGRSGRTSRAFLRDGKMLVNPGDGTNPLQQTLDLEMPSNVTPIRSQG